MTHFELKKFADDNELAQNVADLWLSRVTKTPAQTVALSGGTIAGKFFQQIAERSSAQKISLSQVDFFWADERCVPPGDSQSNFLLADENLFRPLKIAPARIHRLDGELEPSLAVAKANQEISQSVSERKNQQPSLDVVFLGVGPDGHVASLFPHATEAIWNCAASFLFVENSPKPPPRRISLSLAALVAAKEIWVLASGSGKESILRESLSPAGKTPLARVIQARQQTRIFTDVNF
ncbi:MAG: 6-phosphogluconolactonase [Verrucomicrobiota bacterium]